MSKKAKIEKAAKVETAESKPKVVKESKLAEETKANNKTETKTRNQFGHSEGTQSYTIDSMLAKGATLDDIAAKAKTSRGRVRSHIRHLEVSHSTKCNVSKDGIHKLAPTKGGEGK